MVPNDTEWTTEDILSVETGYKATFYRFIENLVSLDLWAELIKKSTIPVWSNFQIWGKKQSVDFMVPNDTERTTEDILSVETGYKTTIYRVIENLVSLHFWSEMKKVNHTGMVKFSDLGSRNFR